jgi:hypothetical protein
LESKEISLIDNLDKRNDKKIARSVSTKNCIINHAHSSELSLDSIFAAYIAQK